MADAHVDGHDGEAQRRTSQLLSEMLPLLSSDPQLHQDTTIMNLLRTESHIIIRYEQYLDYPSALKNLCKCYNPVGYLDAIQQFLDTPDSFLDFGYGLPLKLEAWECGPRPGLIQGDLGVSAALSAGYRGSQGTRPQTAVDVCDLDNY